MAKKNGKIEYQIRRGLKNRAVFTVDSAAVGPTHSDRTERELEVGEEIDLFMNNRLDLQKSWSLSYLRINDRDRPKMNSEW